MESDTYIHDMPSYNKSMRWCCWCCCLLLLLWSLIVFAVGGVAFVDVICVCLFACMLACLLVCVLACCCCLFLSFAFLSAYFLSISFSQPSTVRNAAARSAMLHQLANQLVQKDTIYT